MALVEFASPSEFFCRSGSALLASSAPPSPFERPRGLPCPAWLPRPRSRKFLSWSSRPLQSRSASRPPALRSRDSCLRNHRVPPELGIRLSWSSRSLEHNDAGCPGPPAPAVKPKQARCGLPDPHRFRPQGSCPSRRFGPRSRHARTPCGARRSPCRPDALRPCFMPLAPLESLFRAFPSRGAVPALAGLCFRAGSRSTRPTARHGPRFSRPLSPIAPTTRHGWPCGSPD